MRPFFGFLFFGIMLLGGGCFGAEILFQEKFDGLGAGVVAGQGDWADNSKLGNAQVVAGNSLSEPNHLEVWEGGAVHHAVAPWTGSPTRLAVEFAVRLRATEAGRNLQISLRGKGGEPVLFVNMRGSGRSIDIGTQADALVEHAFTAELPKDTWCLVKVDWSLLSGQLALKVISADQATEYLAERLELPAEGPARIIIGSTSKTQAEEWALDDLVIEARD